MAVIKDGWAMASLILMIASVVLSVVLCIWLKIFYYPGGRKKSDVIDIGVLPMYTVAMQQQKEAEAEDQHWVQHQSGASDAGGDELYYEMMPKDAPQHQQTRPSPPPPVDTRDDLYDDLPVRRGVQMLQI
eukprot:jgi/Mesen1/3262/ME000019S02680